MWITNFDIQRKELEKELLKYDEERRIWSEAGLNNLKNGHPTFALDAYSIAAKFDEKIKILIGKIEELDHEREVFERTHRLEFLNDINKGRGIEIKFDIDEAIKNLL